MSNQPMKRPDGNDNTKCKKPLYKEHILYVFNIMVF